MSPSYSLQLLWDWQGGKVTLLSHLMRLIKCVCRKLSAEKAVFVKGFWVGAQKVREIRMDYCCILIFLSLERITKYHHWKYPIGISKPIWALKIEEAGRCFQGASGYFYIETCRQTEGCSSHTQVYWLQASCEQGPGTAISTQSWASAGMLPAAGTTGSRVKTELFLFRSSSVWVAALTDTENEILTIRYCVTNPKPFFPSQNL